MEVAGLAMELVENHGKVAQKNTEVADKFAAPHGPQHLEHQTVANTEQATPEPSGAGEQANRRVGHQLLDPLGRLQKVQGVGRRRGVENNEIVATLAVEQPQLGNGRVLEGTA